jgi:7-carboxy-7-deazaguanine synthase
MTKDEPTIRVSDLSHWLSSEGPLFGRPSARLRLGLAAQAPMTPTEILDSVREQSMPFHIVLTGDPAVEPVDSLILRAQALGYRMSCIVSGAQAADWFANLDELVLVPFPPSSGTQVDLPQLDDALQVAYTGESRTDVSLYIPIATEEDYRFAHSVANLHPTVPMWLGADGPSEKNNILGWTDGLQWVAQRVVDDCWDDVRVVPHLRSWF